MTRREDDLYGDAATERFENVGDAATERFENVGDGDAFLDALARGEDPSHGSDQLAVLFLDLKDEVDQPMPSPPTVTAPPHMAEQPAPVELSPAGEYDELAHRRTPGREGVRGGGARGVSDSAGHKISPWLSGFVGAAAATVLVAGSGAALYHATPGSPLWGPASAVFGDRTAAVELASTLDELEAANQEGDSENFSALLRQARALVNSLNATGSPGEQRDDDRFGAHSSTDPAPTATVTVTVPLAPEPEGGTQPPEPPPAPAAPAPQAGAPKPAAPAPPRPQVPPAPSQPVRPAPSQQPPQPAPPPSTPRPESPSKPPQVNPPAPDPQLPPTQGAPEPDPTLEVGPAAVVQAGTADGSST